MPGPRQQDHRLDKDELVTGHMVSQGAKIFKMASEEGNLTNEMSIELFSRWKVDQLKTFLKKEELSYWGENMSSLRRRILHGS